MILIERSQVTPQPWKNGGGVLHELLRVPAGDAWQIRIAVADIDADGLFSDFPGVERWFTVLHGAGVELLVQAARQPQILHRVLAGNQPLRFDGGAQTHCRLIDGTVQALNLMLRGAYGCTAPVVDGCDWVPESTSCGIYSNVAGQCNGTDMPAGSLLWFDVAPERLRFTATHVGDQPSAWWLAASMEAAR